MNYPYTDVPECFAGNYRKELLRTARRTVGRLDSRYVGIDRNTVGRATSEFDPANAATTPVRPPACSVLFEVFLCLSRACLGKMIRFSIKSGQKTGLLCPARTSPPLVLSSMLSFHSNILA